MAPAPCQPEGRFWVHPYGIQRIERSTPRGQGLFVVQTVIFDWIFDSDP